MGASKETERNEPTGLPRARGSTRGRVLGSCVRWTVDCSALAPGPQSESARLPGAATHAGHAATHPPPPSELFKMLNVHDYLLLSPHHQPTFQPHRSSPPQPQRTAPLHSPLPRRLCSLTASALHTTPTGEYHPVVIDLLLVSPSTARANIISGILHTAAAPLIAF